MLQGEDFVSKEMVWQVFKTIKVRGKISWTEDTNQLEVTTNDLIYFYSIDE